MISQTQPADGGGQNAPPLRVSGFETDSIVDGPGLRFTVFVQGCPHHCAGCHNPQTHDFSGGKIVELDRIVQYVLDDPLVGGVTFSGGEPFCQAAALCALGEKICAIGKNIVVYSGYTFEKLIQMGEKDPDILRLLRMSDLLIDGLYLEAERDLTLEFRGSRNQRLIDLKEQREMGNL